MWRRSTRLAMAFTLAGVGGGCSSAMEREPANAFAGETEATVLVTNNNWSDMTVYASRNGAVMRLGTVTSMTTERFTLPSPLVVGSGNLQLVADPLGSTNTYRTQPLLVSPGQQVEFILQNNLALSTLSVW